MAQNSIFSFKSNYITKTIIRTTTTNRCVPGGVVDGEGDIFVGTKILFEICFATIWSMSIDFSFLD